MWAQLTIFITGVALGALVALLWGRFQLQAYIKQSDKALTNILNAFAEYLAEEAKRGDILAGFPLAAWARLGGIWKGAKITEKDIKEAREELLKKLENQWEGKENGSSKV